MPPNSWTGDRRDYIYSAMSTTRPLPGIDPLHLTGDPARARVVVAMSGGVDSSVTAGLLAEAGYDVVGITLQLYDNGAATGRKGACCAGRDIGDARKVASHLSIPHYVLDYEARFKSAVIDEFAASYIAGETPVPCIQCNQKVKFRDLAAMAREIGAAALATGHYVRNLRGADGGWELHQPADLSRDQSYFLFATSRQKLEFLRFPLGGMLKSDVREHGRRLGLPVADKADSQDICFVPKGHYTTVIDRLRPGAAGPGEIVHLDGRVLGRHSGITGYTIGQRKGLGLPGGPEAEPLFVVALDAARARVVVGPRAALAVQRVRLRDVNWLGGDEVPAEGVEIAARVRSTGAPGAARLLRAADGEVAVEFLGTPQFGVSPGQACVFYADASGASRVLGGGWIKAAA